jgi:hypothetical protein
MSTRFIAALRLTQTLVLAAWPLLWAANAQAEEQRCAELGASCICSEPMNTTTFAGGPPFWNPADSTTKQCSVESGAIGGAIVRTTNTITASADATALAALPAGHSVSRFVRANDNHQGTYFVGSGVPVSSSFLRIAARWYMWRTPVFDFVDEGSCENTKITEFDNGARVTYIPNTFSTYNYTEFSPSVDCCTSGPGPDSNVPSSQMKGKWWRYEVVMTNRSGPNFDFKMYAKNVTDDGPELTVIDLSSRSSVRNLTPPSLMSTLLSNNHRYSGSGSCRGWIGISHYMMAGWTTNAGQRIGPAAEIESPGAITPPTNLRVSKLLEELRKTSFPAVPRIPVALGALDRTMATAAWNRGSLLPALR